MKNVRFLIKITLVRNNTEQSKTKTFFLPSLQQNQQPIKMKKKDPS
jgi:hypothetical protein